MAQKTAENAIEFHPHTVEVVGSNPTPPILKSVTDKDLRRGHPVTHGETVICHIRCDISVGQTVGSRATLTRDVARFFFAAGPEHEERQRGRPAPLAS